MEIRLCLRALAAAAEAAAFSGCLGGRLEVAAAAEHPVAMAVAVEEERMMVRATYLAMWTPEEMQAAGAAVAEAEFLRWP